MREALAASLALGLSLALAACDAPSQDPTDQGVGGGGPSDAATAAEPDAQPDAAVPSGPPFAEFEPLLQAYAGQAEVAMESTNGTTTTYEFLVESGPACLRGDPYRFSLRDGVADHDDLLIFLQGGGACWSELCLAIERAGRGIPERANILDPTLASNPVRDWHLAYLPYCDGSFFAGDADHDDDGDGVVDRMHRGAHNLVAALEIARDRHPAPARVVLAGSSGGGFGTITATPLVRLLWPDAELLVFNDAGVGVAKADDPSFLTGLIDEFNGWQFVPPSCEACVGNGHLTRAIAWELARDPNLTVAAFSSYGDFIISRMFLRIGAEAFEQALRAETDALHTQFPRRYVPFLVAGDLHTALLGTGFGGPPELDRVVEFGGLQRTAVDGLTVGAWFQQMLDRDPAWGPVRE